MKFLKTKKKRLWRVVIPEVKGFFLCFFLSVCEPTLHAYQICIKKRLTDKENVVHEMFGHTELRNQVCVRWQRCVCVRIIIQYDFKLQYHIWIRNTCCQKKDDHQTPPPFALTKQISSSKSKKESVKKADY